MLATRNNYHNSRVVNGVRGMTQGIEKKINNTRTYLSLHEINENLAAENVALKNSIETIGKKREFTFFFCY